MKNSVVLTIIFVILSSPAFAQNIIPVGSGDNTLYYRIGGGSDFASPPVSDTTTIHLDSNISLAWSNSCNNFNPALSISNSINNLKDSADNIEQSVIASATGSLIQMPMYFLAQANPTAYSMLNNALIDAHKRIEVSTKSCETIKYQIANGVNPYANWGTIAVGDQWKKHLSFGDSDINDAKKDIDAHSGEGGVSWVQGNKDEEGSLRAGGKNQPPVHVIADATKAGFNAILNRDLQSNDDAINSEMSRYFKNPEAAAFWMTNVVGDQVITTCSDDSCKKAQGNFVGRGLLPWIISCQSDKDNCADNIRDDLTKLVDGSNAISKDNLLKVSADGIVISPDVVSSIHVMGKTQQAMIINKLSQEVAVQRLIDKALIAKDILNAGSDVPAIAANQPAQEVIRNAIEKLEKDIQSLDFSRQIRKKNVSNTLSEVLNYASKQKQTLQLSPNGQSPQMMENGALPTSSESSK
jgi:integrating conjugative element protein (TIGR03755 family)